MFKNTEILDSHSKSTKSETENYYLTVYFLAREEATQVPCDHWCSSYRGIKVGIIIIIK